MKGRNRENEKIKRLKGVRGHTHSLSRAEEGAWVRKEERASS
jgi:hypothetical protein